MKIKRSEAVEFFEKALKFSKAAEWDNAKLVERLKAAGVADTAINLQPVSSQPQWNREGERSGFILQQPLFVVSSDVNAIIGDSIWQSPRTIRCRMVCVERRRWEASADAPLEARQSFRSASRDSAQSPDRHRR